jgi:Tfp pilus assembly protein PilF
VNTAEGGPTDYIPWMKKSDQPAAAVPPVVAPAASSTDSISPVRHPVKYLTSTISVLPSPSAMWKKDPADATKSDSISLDTPTGPPTPQLVIAMAQMAESKGDIAQARQHYQKALKQWPGQVDVLRAAARMEDRLGGLPLAERLYQQAVAANPQHAGAQNDLGLCLARQGKLEQSAQVLERAIQLQPTKALYRNNAATVLAELRQDQRALAHLAAVHGPAEANYNMGQLLVQRGRATDASGYFVAALQIDPNMPAAHAALAGLQGQLSPEVPTMATNPAAPTAVPAFGPQQATPAGPQNAPAEGPQLSFPATARNPAWGASSYVPPGYYAPPAQYPQYPQQVVPQVSQLPPRFLPPVQGQQQPQMPMRR